jgi:hypothetical protein
MELPLIGKYTNLPTLIRAKRPDLVQDTQVYEPKFVQPSLWDDSIDPTNWYFTDFLHKTKKQVDEREKAWRKNNLGWQIFLWRAWICVATSCSVGGAVSQQGAIG